MYGVLVRGIRTVAREVLFCRVAWRDFARVYRSCVFCVLRVIHGFFFYFGRFLLQRSLARPETLAGLESLLNLGLASFFSGLV